MKKVVAPSENPILWREQPGEGKLPPAPATEENKDQLDIDSYKVCEFYLHEFDIQNQALDQ